MVTIDNQKDEAPTDATKSIKELAKRKKYFN